MVEGVETGAGVKRRRVGIRRAGELGGDGVPAHIGIGDEGGI
jgi:hypothetical protein